MRYFVTVNGQEHCVDINEAGSALRATFTPAPAAPAPATQATKSKATGSATETSTKVLGSGSAVRVHVGTQLLELSLDRSGKLPSTVAGEEIAVAVESERERALKVDAAAAGKKSGETLRAQMPGKIVKVIAKPGSPVSAGQSVLIMEAMKMQNDVCATKPGSVATVLVEEGATVDAGAPLVVLE